ncbi:MAG: GAF domain-containing protein, partial [Nocardioidaceae bacterium]
MAPLGDAHDPRTWRTDVSHLDGLNTAAVAINAAGTVVHCNSAAEGLLSRPRAQLVDLDLTELITADDRGAGREIFALAMTGEIWSGRLTMLDPAGSELMLEVSATPLRREGAVVGVLFVLEDSSAETPFHGRAQRVAERLTRLARVTGELVAADDMATVTRAVVSRAADAAGATVAALVRLTDDDMLTIVGVRGASERVTAKYATFPIDDTTPAGTVMRTQRPLIVVGREEIDSRFPGIYDDIDAAGERTMAALPLNVGPRTIGAILLSFPGRRSFDNAEQEFLSLLADTCAQAMDRIHAVAEAEDRAYKLRFLSKASAELTSSLDYEDTLRNVAWLGVPEFADWCSVSLLEDGDLRMLQVAHTDPERVAFVQELQRRYPPDPSSTQGAWGVVKSGRSELIPVITDELLVSAAQDEEHLRLVRELRLRSAVSAPLTARGRMLG